MKSESYLFWLDLEMSGLNLPTDTILEIASVITNNNLDVIAQGPEFVIHQPDSVLEAMDDWNKRQHGGSGLVESVRQSQITLASAAEKTLAFVAEYCKPKTAPLCGNTVYQDRAFLKVYMPHLENYLHYRIIDVSSVKELVRRWYPKDPCNHFEKTSNHRALGDVYASIDELKHYRKYFFKSFE
jgi:oligoribonuclease